MKNPWKNYKGNVNVRRLPIQVTSDNKIETEILSANHPRSGIGIE